MSDANVVILPFHCPDPIALQAEVVGLGRACFLPDVTPIAPDLPERIADARRVALTAMWLNTVHVHEPIVVVAYGSDARLLPALALAQRAAHRRVTGYVIVDGDAPAPSNEWPDAPVWWVLTSQAPQALAEKALTARLRGFDVVEGPALDAIAAAG